MTLRRSLTAGMFVAFAWIARGAPPANDNFASRTPIVGAAAEIQGTTVESTLEGSAEPTHLTSQFNFAVGSVWWTWTAPISGTVVVTLPDTGDFPHVINVFSGASLATLSLTRARFRSGADGVVFHAVAGAEYQIAVARYGFNRDPMNPGTSFSFSLSMPAAPANDTFAERITLTGSSVSTSGTNDFASPEEGEPYLSLGASVWWSWTAPATGTAIVETGDSAIDTALGVFTGSTFSTLVSQDPYGFDARTPFVGTSRNRLSFPAVAGTTYAIAVDARPRFSPIFVDTGAISLAIEMAPPPPNDQFANRTSLAGAIATFSGSTHGATGEPGEWSSGDYGQIEPVGETIWWSWVAPFTGTATASLNTPDRFLTVRAGSNLGSLTPPVAWDASAITAGRKVFRAQAGVSYVFMVDGSDGQIGPVTGSVSLVIGPPNDLFADRIPLVDAVGSATGSNLNATDDNILNSRDVWWTWTAPASGTLIVDTNGSGFDAVLAVSGGEQDASNRGWGGTYSRVTLPVVSGTDYAIRVSGWQGAAGPVILNHRFAQPPSNDALENAQVIEDISTPIIGNNFGATRVLPSQPGLEMFYDTGGASVWWTWTAPADGFYVISTVGSDFNTMLAVLSDLLEGGGAIASAINDDAAQGVVTSRAFFEAEAGKTYVITVNGYNNAMGNIVLTLRPGIIPTLVAPLKDKIVQVGSDVTLSVQATSTAGPLVYSWRAGLRGPPPSAESSFELRSATLADAGQYSVFIQNDDGFVLNEAQLVVTPVWITGAGAPVAAGSSATFASSIVGAAGATYQWRLNGVAIPGATGASYTLPYAQAHHAGTYRVVASVNGASYESNGQVLAVAPTPSSDARLLNVSTRGPNLSNDNVLIAGFVIAGTGSKRLLLRAVGPELATHGVGGVQADPQIVLKRRDVTTDTFVDVAANDNWSAIPQPDLIVVTAQAVGAFALEQGSADAALVVDLAAGTYTVNCGGANGSQGIALAELYDADGSATTSRLVNLSTRGRVGTGGNILISGFAISSEGPRTVLIRAVGPGLTAFGLSDALADPQLAVFDGATPVLQNDDWDENATAGTVAQLTQAVGAFALDPGSADAALVVTLPPGIYTVHAAGKDAAAGVCLIEVYLAP